jgi:hypothetical protein
MSDGTTRQEPDVGSDVVADGAIEAYVTEHGLVEARGHR